MPVFTGKPKATRERLRELVVAFAEAHRGAMPTLSYCREKLGGGSPNTINKHLQALAVEFGYQRRRAAPTATITELAKVLEPILSAHQAKLSADIERLVSRVYASLQRVADYYQSLLSNQDLFRKAFEGFAKDHGSLRDQLEKLLQQDAAELTELKQRLSAAEREATVERERAKDASSNAKVAERLLRALTKKPRSTRAAAKKRGPKGNRQTRHRKLPTTKKGRARSNSLVSARKKSKR